jgi:LmbE family N-acetylglucosaminyl deacetylase
MSGWSRVAVLSVGVLAALTAVGEAATMDAAARQLALDRLLVTGSALYVAAHPDDENTAMLAYLAQGRGVRTAYLALTRGDGGQNLIGTEQGDALGVIRTHELLAARAIDGAEQFFTRAVDFGYSKTPEETLRFWGHDEVLADVVWVIRSFRPDVVIVRFPANGDGGHGHHTASALLAAEAFAAAGDPARFPQHLAFAAPWQAKRLVWNAWRRPGSAPPVDAPPSVTVDLGAFDPLLGRAYSELAAEARSLHKSQGFGASSRRGALPNDLQHVAGDVAKADLFDGVVLSWNRVAGGAAVAAAIERVRAAYDGRRPATVVPLLLDVLALIDGLPAEPLVEAKRTETLELIQACAGLWLDATVALPEITPGSSAKVTATALNRSDLPLVLERLAVTHAAALAPGAALVENRASSHELTVTVPADMPYSQPFWLAAAHRGGRYEIADQRLRGAAHGPPQLAATFTLRLGERRFEVTKPVVHRWTDPVEGEREREPAIVPPVTVRVELPVFVFAGPAPRPVRLIARAHAVGSAVLELRPPQGWQVEPARFDINFAKTGEERLLAVTITPLAAPASGTLEVRLASPRQEAARTAIMIDYPHIEPQTMLPEASAHLVRVDVRTAARRIGYVMGPGDEIPAILRQLGLDVVLLSDDDLEGGDLDGFDAIVVGARAYNSRERLAALQPRLLAYAERGGRVVVQYQTARELVTDRIGPYPFEVSRTRVTDETAAVTLATGHPLLASPNPIGPGDFAGWVQERGLYFAQKWDERYEAPIAMADPGEEATGGALLFARHGKGSYVYTGLAFFRQLPAGVPGAIRLFVNLLGEGRQGV